MPITQYQARLSEKETIGEKFLFLKLELVEPTAITFEAGQYLLLNCPDSPRKRQYSIVSAPRLEHAVELLVEVIPDGVASGYFQRLQPGDPVSFYAPAGEFFIKPEIQSTTDPLVFVGTGSGLAPLRSMILDQLRTREATRKIHLLVGMRHASELFWLDLYEELHDNFPNFTYHVTLSKAPEDWTLCRGRVTDCLSVHDLLPNAHYYLCGNPHMIDDVMKLLASRGVAQDRVHHEKFS